MKNNCILYNGGSYGTFVEWCLNYFHDLSFEDTLPFSSTGSAHNFHGVILSDYQPEGYDFYTIQQYVESSNNDLFVRAHPVHNSDDDILKKLHYVTNNFNKVIFIAPTINSMAWNINNKLTKVDGEFIGQPGKNYWNSLNERLQTQNIGDVTKMEVWEKREFLSFDLYPQHLAECRFSQHTQIQKEFPNIYFMHIDDLRDNFKQTIISILKYCNLDPVRTNQFNHVYSEWVKKQHYCNKDQLIKKIVTSIVAGLEIDWGADKLTLVDEALIQYFLRENGIEIKCYGLNEFPKNTIELRDYLVKK